MLEFLKKLFTPKETVLVVPMELKSALKDDEDTIRTLLDHPGFLMLINRLKIQKSLLDAKLRLSHHSDLREVDSLQSGMYWLGYLEDTIDKLVHNRKRPVQEVPEDSIMREFNRVRAGIKSA